MEDDKNVHTSYCMHGKAPFLVGLLGVLFIAWLVLSIADKVGLGILSVVGKRTITVTGSANRQQSNQMANFNATVSSKNADKTKAVSEVNQKSQKLMANLKQFGIEEKDLKTQNVNIYRDQAPYWEEGIQKFRDGDWNASVSVEIILRDLTKADSLLELLAKEDTSNLWGPNYSLSEGEPEKAELLTQAFGNAKSKADSLAGGMGLKVGKVISVTEGYELAAPFYSAKSSGMGGGGGADLAAGSTNVSSTLTVTFELR